MGVKSRRPADLVKWINYIQTLHSREIDLTLDRVEEVRQRLVPAGTKFRVFSIAGTNGKGSTAELISSICREAGYSIGKYTSPHILKFNERFNINGIDVDDQQLLLSFERVELARGKTRLTFFEFGTLIAIDLFDKAKIDVAVMEVGLGGRLDATNILDPDVAVVTSISIDHTAWLGDNLEDIAREKIGIARTGRPCVLGMPEPPQSIIDHCRQLGISPLIIGTHFRPEIDPVAATWKWCSKDLAFESLPAVFHQWGSQINNAAVAIQAVLKLAAAQPVTAEAVRAGITKSSVSGRCQLISRSPAVVLDVAHNVDSVAVLLHFIQQLCITGQVYAVCGMMRDKQVAEALSQLKVVVDEWHFATIDNPRAASAEQINTLLQEYSSKLKDGSLPEGQKPAMKSFEHDTAVDAYKAVRSKLQHNDCLIVFGSFFIVSDIIEVL